MLRFNHLNKVKTNYEYMAALTYSQKSKDYTQAEKVQKLLEQRELDKKFPMLSGQGKAPSLFG